MRDLCQKTNIDYGAKLGLATCPKKVKSSVIKRAIRTWIIGTRCPSSSSKWSQTSWMESSSWLSQVLQV